MKLYVKSRYHCYFAPKYCIFVVVIDDQKSSQFSNVSDIDLLSHLVCFKVVGSNFDHSAGTIKLKLYVPNRCAGNNLMEA